MRLLAFGLALLLLAGSVEPTSAWLSVLVGLAAAGAIGLRFRGFPTLRPHLDVRLASLVLAVLLLAGAVEVEKEWLIAMAAVSGVAAFFPGLISLEAPDDGRKRRQHWRRAHNRGRWRHQSSRFIDGEDFV